MPKKIGHALASRVTEIQDQTTDQLRFTAAFIEHQGCFLKIQERVDEYSKDLLMTMQIQSEAMLDFAIKKAYLIGFQDGMKVGEDL